MNQILHLSVSLCTWFTCNKVHLNGSKAVHMLFRDRQCNSSSLFDMNLHLNNQEIARVIEWRKTNLPWDKHIQSICSKAAKGLSALNIPEYFIPQQALKIICNTITLPHFRNGNISVGNTRMNSLERIIKIQ